MVARVNLGEMRPRAKTLTDGEAILDFLCEQAVRDRVDDAIVDGACARSRSEYWPPVPGASHEQRQQTDDEDLPEQYERRCKHHSTFKGPQAPFPRRNLGTMILAEVAKLAQLAPS
jgi:hypothetical protein